MEKNIAITPLRGWWGKIETKYGKWEELASHDPSSQAKSYERPHAQFASVLVT